MLVWNWFGIARFRPPCPRGFTKNLQPLGTSPQLWAARQMLFSPEDVNLRQCKLGELCWLATVSRPDICARLARVAPRINAPKGCDVYRINVLVRIAKKWQPATVLKCVVSAQLGQESLAPRDENARHRKENPWERHDFSGLV